MSPANLRYQKGGQAGSFPFCPRSFDRAVMGSLKLLILSSYTDVGHGTVPGCHDGSQGEVVRPGGKDALFSSRLADQKNPLSIRLSSSQLVYAYMPSRILSCVYLAIIFAGRPDVGNGVSAALLCGNDYAVPSPCLSENVASAPLRVVYLDKQYTTQNQAAIAKIESLGLNYTFGSSCEHKSTAVPEW